MSLKGLFDPGYRELKRTEKIAEKVIALAPEYNKLTDDELKAKTKEFQSMLQGLESLQAQNEKLDEILLTLDSLRDILGE